METLNWILTAISFPAIIAIGIWVGRISERVSQLEKKMDGFEKTREDVIRILTILEQAKLGDLHERFGEVNNRFGEVNNRFSEVNERLATIEAVVKQIAQKDGIVF
ncbi:MAG: hypothetical protein Ta2F_11660 [Termitinemataceae bacterium]|nr:MAG: hypothetical protein Ta2F_11660 [Termitinemataceae bacterium]